MDEQGWLTERFEENRPRLRGVAYRMLGSLSEAEDAVQEAWLRLNRIDAATVDNLGGWLTTVVSRVCLDVLRSRRSRREEPIGAQVTEPSAVRGEGADPEGEAVLADSVGVALLVVLDTLTPAERLAFVLHDLFGMPFDEIGSIVGRSPAAAKQLASRARRRVRGTPAPSDAGRARQREVVEAFLRAARAGDLEGLLAVLDPDAVVRIDAAARIDYPGSGRCRDAAGAQRRLDVGETVHRALARASIRTAGAHRWIDRSDPRAGRETVPGTDLHLRERQDHAGGGHRRSCSPSRARYRGARAQALISHAGHASITADVVPPDAPGAGRIRLLPGARATPTRCARVPPPKPASRGCHAPVAEARKSRRTMRRIASTKTPIAIPTSMRMVAFIAEVCAENGATA